MMPRVICSECGRDLVGYVVRRFPEDAWKVRAHINPTTGDWCWGDKLTNHTEAP